MKAYEFYSQKLKDKDMNDKYIEASQILHTIQQVLQVVMINLSNADDPYLIFGSLNHKGQPLNQADLVRNYVLMRFKHSALSGANRNKRMKNCESQWKRF
jgi:uncharacterized protein with ParB-like and HNH nuclease domain